MEENKVALSDSLGKAAAWTHNTNMNRVGYSPLTLVTVLVEFEGEVFVQLVAWLSTPRKLTE